MKSLKSVTEIKGLIKNVSNCFSSIMAVINLIMSVNVWNTFTDRCTVMNKIMCSTKNLLCSMNCIFCSINNCTLMYKLAHK